MEQTNLEDIVVNQININTRKTKEIVTEQTLRLQRLLVSKISEQTNLPSEKLNELMEEEFSLNAQNAFESVFKYFETEEQKFFKKNMTTADLIFNTLKEKRVQVIYLDNIIKKIEEKSFNVENTLEEILSSNKEKSGDYLKIILNKSMKRILSLPGISLDEAEKITQVSTHYYKLYHVDVISTIEHYLYLNKKFSINNVESEMDNKKLRGKKNSSIAKLERTIITSSKNAIDVLLNESIQKNKIKSREELKICASAIINVIFKLMPDEYKNQQSLLEVIIDTNINERLGKILDEETDTLSQTLKEKNYEAIDNELYEEKRYRKIRQYELELSQIDTVYQDVLKELKTAYDIPEDDINLKRLSLVLLSESNSTKKVFKNSINNINTENELNLGKVLEEMNKLSRKAIGINNNNNSIK